MNGYGQKDLDDLRNAGVTQGVPKTIADIDFNGNSSHRQYTHMGWDYDYSQQGEGTPYANNRPDTANWQLRKIILSETVETVFGFKSPIEWIEGKTPFTPISFNEKCNHMAKFIYYVHICADYNYALKELLNGNIKRVNDDMMPLACPRMGLTKDTDLFDELLNCAKVLFDSLDNSDSTYTRLVSEIDRAADEARYIALDDSWRNGDSESNGNAASDLLAKAEELQTTVQKRYPPLFRHCGFFQKAFPNT